MRVMTVADLGVDERPRLGLGTAAARDLASTTKSAPQMPVLAALADRFVQREHQPGDLIVQSGQNADQLVLIAHGKVDLGGSMALAWRGVPLLPCNKIPVSDAGAGPVLVPDEYVEIGRRKESQPCPRPRR